MFLCHKTCVWCNGGWGLGVPENFSSWDSLPSALINDKARMFSTLSTFQILTALHLTRVGGTYVEMSTERFKILDRRRSDSSMFDGREAVDRLDNRSQSAVYWAPHAAAETPDAIFLSEFLIQPLSFDTSGAKQMDLYIRDLNFFMKTQQINPKKHLKIIFFSHSSP